MKTQKHEWFWWNLDFVFVGDSTSTACQAFDLTPLILPSHSSFGTYSCHHRYFDFNKSHCPHPNYLENWSKKLQTARKDNRNRDKCPNELIPPEMSDQRWNHIIFIILNIVISKNRAFSERNTFNRTPSHPIIRIHALECHVLTKPADGFSIATAHWHVVDISKWFSTCRPNPIISIRIVDHFWKQNFSPLKKTMKLQQIDCFHRIFTKILAIPPKMLEYLYIEPSSIVTIWICHMFIPLSTDIGFAKRCYLI